MNHDHGSREGIALIGMALAFASVLFIGAIAVGSLVAEPETAIATETLALGK